MTTPPQKITNEKSSISSHSFKSVANSKLVCPIIAKHRGKQHQHKQTNRHRRRKNGVVGIHAKDWTPCPPQWFHQRLHTFVCSHTYPLFLVISFLRCFWVLSKFFCFVQVYVNFCFLDVSLLSYQKRKEEKNYYKFKDCIFDVSILNC